MLPRLGDLPAVEVRSGGKLERERVVRESSVGRRLGEEARDRDRPLSDGLDDGALPRVHDLLELDVRCAERYRPAERRGSLRVGSVPARGSARPAAIAAGCGDAGAGGVRAALEELDAVCERLAREVRVRARDLDDRELEREARVAALAHVLDRHREQVDESQDGRLRKLVRLLAEELLRLLGHRQRRRGRGPCAGRGAGAAGARGGR